MWILDLQWIIGKKKRTRYYVSSKTGRVLWLEYEQAATDGGQPTEI